MGGVNSKGGCEKVFLASFFPKNCMKLKEFRPGRDARPWRLFRSANASSGIAYILQLSLNYTTLAIKAFEFKSNITSAEKVTSSGY